MGEREKMDGDDGDDEDDRSVLRVNKNMDHIVHDSGLGLE